MSARPTPRVPRLAVISVLLLGLLLAGARNVGMAPAHADAVPGAWTSSSAPGSGAVPWEPFKKIGVSSTVSLQINLTNCERRFANGQGAGIKVVHRQAGTSVVDSPIDSFPRVLHDGPLR